MFVYSLNSLKLPGRFSYKLGMRLIQHGITIQSAKYELECVTFFNQLMMSHAKLVYEHVWNCNKVIHTFLKFSGCDLLVFRSQ